MGIQSSLKVGTLCTVSSSPVVGKHTVFSLINCHLSAVQVADSRLTQLQAVFAVEHIFVDLR